MYRCLALESLIHSENMEFSSTVTYRTSRKEGDWTGESGHTMRDFTFSWLKESLQWVWL